MGNNPPRTKSHTHQAEGSASRHVYDRYSRARSHGLPPNKPPACCSPGTWPDAGEMNGLRYIGARMYRALDFAAFDRGNFGRRLALAGLAPLARCAIHDFDVTGLLHADPDGTGVVAFGKPLRAMREDHVAVFDFVVFGLGGLGYLDVADAFRFFRFVGHGLPLGASSIPSRYSGLPCSS